MQPKIQRQSPQPQMKDRNIIQSPHPQSAIKQQKENILKITRISSIDETTSSQSVTAKGSALYQQSQQIDLLDTLQQKIQDNLNQTTPQLLNVNQFHNIQLGSTYYQYSASFSRMLINSFTYIIHSVIQFKHFSFSQKSNKVDFKWSDIREQLMQREKEFLSAIKTYQELTINSKFERQILIKAKNQLLSFRFEQKPTPQINYQKFDPIVKLAQNLVAFIELFEMLLQQQKEAQIEQEQQYRSPNLLYQKRPSPSSFKPFKSPTVKSPLVKSPRSSQSKSPLRKSQIITKSPQPKINIEKKSPDTTTSKKINTSERRKSSDIPLTEKKKILITREIQSQRSPTKNEFKSSTKQKLPRPATQMASYHSNKQSKNRDSQLKINKLKQEKSITSQDESSVQKLKELILKNKQNIRQLMQQQIDLKWQIEKETKQLQKQLEKMELQDEFKRNQEWQRDKNKEFQAEIKLQDKKIKQDSRTFRQELSVGSRQTTLQNYPEDKRTSIRTLKSELSKTEKDREELEDQLTKLLQIIDEKAKKIPEEYQRVKSSS